MTEKTVLRLIREELESKLFPPEPQGYEGEKIHAALNKKLLRILTRKLPEGLLKNLK